MLASKSIVVNGRGTGNRTLISRLKAGDNAIILYLHKVGGDKGLEPSVSAL